MKSDLFTFVTVREPQQSRDDDGEVARTFGFPDGETELHVQLRAARQADDARRAMVVLAERHLRAAGHGGREPSSFERLDRLLARRGPVVRRRELSETVRDIFGASVDKVVASPDYRHAVREAADGVIAASIAPSVAPQRRADFVRMLRLLVALERLADDKHGHDLVDLRAEVLLPPDLFPLPAPERDSEARKVYEHALKAAEQARQGMFAAAGRLANLQQALADLAAAIAANTADFRRHSSGDETQQGASLVLSEATVRTLQPATRDALDEVGVPRESIDAASAVATLEAAIASEAESLYRTRRTGAVVALGNVLVPADVFDGRQPVKPGGLGNPGPCPPPLPEAPADTEISIPEGVGTIRPIGIADLMVAEQEIQRYELAEISHIENVLQGEGKDRHHRRARTTEESLLVETERTEETERELETTERFELQLETQETLREDARREAGVTATARYGSVLEVTANASIASEVAREAARRSATTYAREVTDRAVSRVQERALERRFRRTVEEVEETNVHTLDNTDGEGHVIGIYRWVEKIYEVQVVNYGRRMMFEFIVPEPAAFLRHARSRQPVEGLGIEKPDPPGYCASDGRTFMPLAPADITESSYLFWVGRYGAQSVEPPPPVLRTVAGTFDQPAVSDNRDAKSSSQITVPPGYLAKTAWTTRGPIFEESADQEMKLFIGRREATGNVAALDDEDGAIPLAVIARNLLAYTVTIEILCQRSLAHYQAWQLATFNAIMLAYQEQLAQYEERVNAMLVQQAVGPSALNPAVVREIENVELRRGCLSLLTGQHFDAFDAMRRRVAPYGYPQMSLVEAEAEGRYIQFFEQAFEWIHMTYTLYPYFWGRKEEWPPLVLLDDEDLTFARFLRAGAARVQVPVRPGYEDAILHYIESGGEIWEGGDPPHVDDPLFLSIVDEIRERDRILAAEAPGTLSVTAGQVAVRGTDTAFVDDDVDRQIVIAGDEYRIATVSSDSDLALTEPYRGATRERVRYAIGPTLVGEPWEVRVPTSLVYLQENAELPDFAATRA